MNGIFDMYKFRHIDFSIHFMKRLLLLYFVQLTLVSPAQEVSTPLLVNYSYTVEDGLNSNFVTDLLNDSRGILWIGTQNGLNTFDGKQFRSVDFSKVPESFVAKTIETDKGEIWFTTLGGGIYQVLNNIAIPHAFNDTIVNLTKGTYIPSVLHIDSMGTLFSSGNSLYFEIRNDRLTVLDSIKNRNEVNKWELKEDVLLGCTKIGDKLVINFGDSLIHFDDIRNDYTNGFIGNSSNSFAFDRGNVLFSFMNHQIDTILLEDWPSNCIYYESDSSLWVGTQGSGVYHILNNRIEKRLLLKERVHAFIKDFEGGYWIGSENGLFYYPNLITNYLEVRDKKKDFLYIGQYRGELTGIQKPNVLFHADRIKESKEFSENLYNHFNGITDGGVTQILNYKPTLTPRFTYVSWEDLSIYKKGPQRHRIYVHKKDTMSISHQNISLIQNNKVVNEISLNRTMHFQPTGNADEFYFTCKQGLAQIRLNSKENELELLKLTPSLTNMRFLFRIKDEMIASCADDYLYRVDTLQNKLNRLRNDKRMDVRTVHQLDSTTVLLGTSEGLQLISQERIDKQDSLVVRNLNNELGLTLSQVDYIEVIQDRIYALCQGQVIIYPIQALEFNPNQNGRIKVDAILINGSEQEEDQTIYNNQTVTFKVSAVSFKDRKNYLPQFQLIPLQKEPQPLKDNEIRFYNLSADDYTLKITDRYNQSIVYSFTVSSPFYQNWWFIGLMAILSTVLLLLPFFVKYHYASKNLILEAEKDNWRLKSLTSQLKPHFIFNALSSIQSFILKNNPMDSSEFLAKFSVYIRNALDQSRNDFLPLSKGIESIKTYLELERLRLNNSFDFQIEKDELINAETVLVPAMLIQPYVENAVVHGVSDLDYPGNILVKMSRLGEGSVEIKIKDNGKGLHQSVPNKKGLGISSSINDKRLQLLNKYFKDLFYVQVENNKNERGVCVTIEIFDITLNEKSKDLFS